MKKSGKKPFSPAENHSYNVNVAMLLGNPGKAVLMKEFLRSFKYWKDHGDSEIDGYHWFFLRMDRLKETYPEFKIKTVYRWIKDLENLWLIASRNDLNKHGYDKTRWFTVNEDLYEELVMGDGSGLVDSQNENRGRFSEWANGILKMRTAILKMDNSNSQNETTIHPYIDPLLHPCIDPLEEKTLFPGENEKLIEILKEKNKEKRESEILLDMGVEVVKYFNEMSGRNVSVNKSGRGSDNVKWVVDLLRKKYSVSDLKLMIEFKVYEWKGDDVMEKFLDPVTMFKRHGVRYIETAKEAKENGRLAEVMRKYRKRMDMNNSELNGSKVNDLKNEILKNW
jgi:uncharacterized phage protein (TIGR02220 family)